MVEFEEAVNAGCVPGIVIRVAESNPTYLRVTHVFPLCIYVMTIDGPERARYARRPRRLKNAEVETLLLEPGSRIGRIRLPSELTPPNPSESTRQTALESAWQMIEPLIDIFESETGLQRNRYTAAIRARAAEVQTSFISLNRMVLRYYYFGRAKFALLPLATGPKPGSTSIGQSKTSISDPSFIPKRRGRQSILSTALGKNNFVVSEDDIEDMVACLKSNLRKGATTVVSSHEDYLARNFKRRHPKEHELYLQNKIPEPVTKRQFDYYITLRERLEDDLAQNLRTHKRNPGLLGSLSASGPGELYEFDSSGARIHLVSSDDQSTPVGKPTAYVLVDRWSRFVVSAYLSLQAPSYDEVRQALLVAFTSRESRFKRLGIDVDDEQWPIGRIPAVLCIDRGSDFMSDAMINSVVNDLRIEVTPLPPYRPDGKAIVERLFREFKSRMANAHLPGVYAERPMDPKTKKVARKAEKEAALTLSEMYRRLIEMVVDYNSTPHEALRNRRILKRYGIKPTPKEAYVWGLKGLTGLRSPPYTDHDYQKMLLREDNATIASGIVRYKRLVYKPANESAMEIANDSTRLAKAIKIRLDRLDPSEVHVQRRGRDWAIFRATEGSLADLSRITLDEVDASSGSASLLWATADHDSRRNRVAAKSAETKHSSRRGGNSTIVDAAHKLAARKDQSDKLKRSLTGNSASNNSELASKDDAPSPTADWMKIEEQNRLNIIALIKKNRENK